MPISMAQLRTALAMPAFSLSGRRRDYIGVGTAIEPSSGFMAPMGYSADEPRSSGRLSGHLW